MSEQSSNRRIDVFFYGLFMDESILCQSGVAPVNSRKAYVPDFALRIGQRATLAPSPRVCGLHLVNGLSRATQALDGISSCRGPSLL
jgi:hypothetical protein